MNEIRPNNPVPRPGVLGAHGLRALELDIEDLSAAGAFTRALGLTYRRGVKTGTVHVPEREEASLCFAQGPRTRLRALTFGCFAADLPALARRAAELGYGCARKTPDGFAVEGPDGILSMFAASAPRPRPSPAGGLTLPRVHGRKEMPLPAPAWLSHAAIFTADLPGALAFYTGVVGLRLSDRSGDHLAFLHAPHGSDHHVIALVQSSTGGLHHHSWEMGTVDAIGLRAIHMREQGYERGWGLGRHVLGSNYFHYLRDPWGSHAELTAGLEYIEGDQSWIAGDHSLEDGFYLWGPPPPPDFIDNVEAKDVVGQR